MSTEPRREEQEDEPAGSATNTTLPTSAPSELAEFAPHAVIDLRGVLICCQPRSRTSEVLSALCLAPLMDQVQQAGVWDIKCADPEGRFGDYRFLVVEFTDTAGICRYVQVWTEPHCDLIMEVGPGNREDTALQAVAARIRPTLTGRGFEIGGNANNFRKFLVAATEDNAKSVASEMLAILTDVLGYDGTVDLTYRCIRTPAFTKVMFSMESVSRSYSTGSGSGVSTPVVSRTRMMCCPCVTVNSSSGPCCGSRRSARKGISGRCIATPASRCRMMRRRSCSPNSIRSRGYSRCFRTPGTERGRKMLALRPQSISPVASRRPISDCRSWNGSIWSGAFDITGHDRRNRMPLRQGVTH